MTASTKVSFAESFELKAIEIGRVITALYSDIIISASPGKYGAQETTRYEFLLRDSEEEGFLGLWTRRSRYHIATLWFRNEARDVKSGEWLCEVFGREYVQPLTRLAEQLAERFDTKIHLRLKTEKHQYEFAAE
ncbi:MAG TPA: hypothetical protein VN665_01830 [Candidatus Paceibacterota bacterium]|nr:hypothetical protein [Candidatus Paceibacterota bacterium]